MFAGILWVISFFVTFLAFINYFLTEPQNVMQQAALAAMTIVYILVPYCLARAFSSIKQIEHQKKNDKIINELLLELQKINNDIQEDYSKLTLVANISKEINKSSLIYKICVFDEFNNHSHESISWRINYLENMAKQDIITVEELEAYKKQLLKQFENFLKRKLEGNN